MKDKMKNLNYNLFLQTSDTKLAKFCEEVFSLADRHPRILEMISSDQDALGLKKKKFRLLDREYEKEKHPNLPGLPAEASAKSVEPSTLHAGRPRMRPEIVLLFMCLRGYYGSVTDKSAVERYRDSMTLYVLFGNLNMRMPKPTTILDNLNCLTENTRSFVMRCQLNDALELGLDDFETVVFDSTSVKASSSWPTDAGVILRLLERAYAFSVNLDDFGVKSIPLFYLEDWFGKLKKLLFKINTARGTKKCKKQKKLRRLYDDFLETAMKAHEYLVRQWEKRLSSVYSIDLKPSVKQALKRLARQIEDDLLAAAGVIYYADDRMFNDVTLPASDKILSVSDTTAAFIKKGDRNAVVGYKPQLARSSNGFVTAIIVEKGNPADSANLLPLTKTHAENTGVVPKFVSADDGYSSGAGRSACLDFGVEDVCLSGAVGKKITPDALWESDAYVAGRRNRSAVESLMFTLKYVFEFGELRRRGLENATAEMMEEVIAYNIMRKLLLVERLDREKIEEELKKTA